MARLVWLALLELAAPAVAAALAPLFYWRLLIGRPEDAATLPTGDLTDLHYPYRRWVAEQFARGDGAFWNQFVGAGESAIGDIQYHVLYPPDALLARWIGGAFPLRALELGIVAHVALGSLFMYLLARRLTRSRVGGLVAAIVFAFGGYLAGFPVQQMILLETSVWLPGVLLCIDLGADLGLLTPFVVGAGLLALAALAGHPQTFSYVVGASALYLLYKAWNAGRPRVAALLGLPVIVVGGLALAASALLPAYEYLSLTDRTQVTYAFSSTGFGLRELTGLVFPAEFGGEPLYNGVFTLVLVAVALLSPVRRLDKRFWIGFGLLGLLLSFGGNTFLESLQYLALGALRFRDHERLSFYVSIALALLAGFGAAELSRKALAVKLGGLTGAARWPVLFLAGFVAVLLAIRSVPPGNAQVAVLELGDKAEYTLLVFLLGWAIVVGRERRLLPASAAGLLCVALVGFDLFTVNWQANLRPGDPDQVLAPPPIVQYLQSYGDGLFRISSEGLLPGDGNAGMLYRLDDLVINSPLETVAYSQFDHRVTEWTRWQLLDVRYVVTKRQLTDPRVHSLMSDGKANLYEIDAKQRLPRAYVVNDVVAAPSHDLALQVVNQIDVSSQAVVESPAAAVAMVKPTPTPTGASTPTPSQTAQLGGQVRIAQDDESGMVVDLQLPRTGLLVVGDADQPGWSASLDGRGTPIYPADGLLRSVVVPAGSHEVRFWFEPPGLALGQSVAARALVLLEDLVVADVVVQVGWRLARLAYRRYRYRPWNWARRGARSKNQA